MRSVGGSFTGGPFDSELVVGGAFTFDLVANFTSATDRSVLELAFASYPPPNARCSNLRPAEQHFLGAQTVCFLPKYP